MQYNHLQFSLTQFAIYSMSLLFTFLYVSAWSLSYIFHVIFLAIDGLSAKFVQVQLKYNLFVIVDSSSELCV